MTLLNLVQWECKQQIWLSFPNLTTKGFSNEKNNNE
jgi:hypothetical protein